MWTPKRDFWDQWTGAITVVLIFLALLFFVACSSSPAEPECVPWIVTGHHGTPDYYYISGCNTQEEVDSIFRRGLLCWEKTGIGNPGCDLSDESTKFHKLPPAPPLQIPRIA
jgi:hypothetical protein